jgi:hypothetical protein
MKVLRDNGLTIVLVLATSVTILGMLVTGLTVYNEELAQHDRRPFHIFEISGLAGVETSVGAPFGDGRMRVAHV